MSYQPRRHAAFAVALRVDTSLLADGVTLITLPRAQLRVMMPLLR